MTASENRRAGAAPVRTGRRNLLAVFGSLLAIGCTPLTAFNALVAKDDGVTLAAKDAAYGPEPRQKLDIYRPSASGDRPMPVIVFFYGGSWNSGTKDGYAFVGQALASRGFVVVIADYRLVPQVRYPAFVEDCAAAVRWVHRNAQRFGGDPDQLIVAGHSAGAYNGAMVTYDPRWLGAERRAIKGFIGLAGPYDFLPFDGPVIREAFKGTADLASTQPVRFVSRGDPPAFLATGAKDTFVLPRNSDLLAARLRAVGSSARRKIYASVGHIGILTAIAKPLRNRASVVEDMADFIRAILTPHADRYSASLSAADRSKVPLEAIANAQLRASATHIPFS